MLAAGDDFDELLDVRDELAIDLHVHDSSRLEWKAVLPASRLERYRIVFELEVPANLFVKTIGVVDRATRVVRLVEAPRRYRLPVRVTVTSGDLAHEQAASLVLDKAGLARLETLATVNPHARLASPAGAPSPLGQPGG